MIAIIGLLTIVIISIVVVRIGSIAFELTGLSPDVAGFQAQSAFSGVGFTTSESETIVNHPVRRRIARILILVGSVGLTSTMATLIVALTNIRSDTMIYQTGMLFGGLLVIFLFSRSKLVYNLTKKIVVKALSKNKTLKIHDYQEILGFSKGYAISRLSVKRNNWLVGKKLMSLKLQNEGTLILSINRKIKGDEKFLIPSGETEIQQGDQLTMYGRHDCVECLFNRGKGKEGDEAHAKRCELEKKRIEMQEAAGELID